MSAWGRAARFSGGAVAAALSPSTYRGAARAVALRQVYFTAWQILPGFTLFAGTMSAVVIEITVSTAREFGLAEYALEMIFRALVLELIPLLTALFVALRSGAAIGTEIALMRVSGALERMQAAGIDPLRREFVPRVAACALSVASLIAVSCVVALVLAYVAMYGFLPWGFDAYTRVVAVVFNPPVVAGFALRCAAFGIAVGLIPIAAGLGATRQLKSAPVAVHRGMVRLFFALGAIEVLSLAVKYV